MGGKQLVKKTMLLSLFLGFSILIVPMVPSVHTTQSGPELESHIRNGFRVATFEILVTNVGDETAHNVRISNATVTGNIFFNFQESKLPSEDIQPDRAIDLDTRSLVIGFGNFTLSITVTCDEGASSTSSVVGLIMGPFMIIP